MTIYQAKSGSIEFREDVARETIWASLDQIATLFERDKSVVSRHITNIFKEEELSQEGTVAKNATVQKEGGRTVRRKITFYNLDMILSVGYRVNSKAATKFRQWSSKILKQHITEGFTINPKQLEKNKAQFLKTVEDLKLLSKTNPTVEASDVLSLIQDFSHTWFSLERYDKSEFPTQGTKEELQLSADELIMDLQKLKAELLERGEATQLFGQEKRAGTMAGIFGSVFQSVFGQDAYPSIEEKAAHLLYFTVKNHPFNDGNKRSGAFCFIWLLQKAKYSFAHKITPEALTTLTLLIAESDPAEKNKLIGLILLLLS